MEVEQQEQGRCTDQGEGYHPGETGTGPAAGGVGFEAGEPGPAVEFELEAGWGVVERGEAERYTH